MLTGAEPASRIETGQQWNKSALDEVEQRLGDHGTLRSDLPGPDNLLTAGRASR